MPGEEYFSEASFAELFDHLVLPKTATGIEILPSGSIQCCFVLYELKVVFEILSPLRVKEPQMIDVHDFSNLFEIQFLSGEL